MAEFQEVIKQTKRMCEANFDCSDCPLKGETQCIAQVHNGIIPSIWNEDTYRDMERIVMKWVEEHPEPKYPTWTEWLRTFSAKGIDLYSPIPADIAEKLGIKPKEE